MKDNERLGEQNREIRMEKTTTDELEQKRN